MKNFTIQLIWCVTAFLIIYTVLAYYGVTMPVLISLAAVGQVFIVFLAYKILTDDIKTDKTFKDWYEDRPVNTLEE